MKKLMIILVILAMAFTAKAATLIWDAPTGNVDGYLVYYTDGTGNRSKKVETASIDLKELNLTPGEYTFYVTAYNTNGESGPSNTVEWTLDAFVPTENIKPVTIVFPGPVTITIK